MKKLKWKYRKTIAGIALITAALTALYRIFPDKGGWISGHIGVDTSAAEISTGKLPSNGPFRVKRVLDGDTFILDNGERVRLIGVDAPETSHPEIPVQRFGKEAKKFLKRLVEGFECRLEYESGNLRGKYGRLLAYVYLDTMLVNAELIRKGYAYAYTKYPFSRMEEFRAIEREAREKGVGLWDYSLKDGRVANLVSRYESLNKEGRRKLDRVMEGLVDDYRREKDPDTDSFAPVEAKGAADPSPRSEGAEKSNVVSWRDADEYIGEHKSVAGRIVATHNSGKACFLNFHENYKRYFTAVIFKSDFHKFPDRPEEFYKGKRVRVSGRIKRYKGKPEIILNDPDQIRVVD